MQASRENPAVEWVERVSELMDRASELAVERGLDPVAFRQLATDAYRDALLEVAASAERKRVLAERRLRGAGSSAAGVDGAESPPGLRGHHEPVGERQGRQPVPLSGNRVTSVDEALTAAVTVLENMEVGPCHEPTIERLSDAAQRKASALGYLRLALSQCGGGVEAVAAPSDGEGAVNA